MTMSDSSSRQISDLWNLSTPHRNEVQFVLAGIHDNFSFQQGRHRSELPALEDLASGRIPFLEFNGQGDCAQWVARPTDSDRCLCQISNGQPFLDAHDQNFRMRPEQ